MRELSLNVMDVAQNSISAGAQLITVTVKEEKEELVITIADNGKGMTPEQVQSVPPPPSGFRSMQPKGSIYSKSPAIPEDLPHCALL